MSATVQVTVVVPTGKLAGASLVTVATPQLSPVTGVPSLTPLAAHLPASTLTVTAAGQVMVGFSASFTVTFWAQVAVLPEVSVTVHVTVVSPAGKVAGALLVT